MRLLANPAFLRMIVLLLGIGALFIFGVALIRRMRQSLLAELSTPTPRADHAPGFTVAAFQGVIQQMKVREQELERLRQEEQERAWLREGVSAAVLANLEIGVVVFNDAGLGQSANPAAREILGYATVSGMHARDLFRGVTAVGEMGGVADALQSALRDATVSRIPQAEYATPSGERRELAITVAPALGSAGQCYGAVCLVKLHHRT